MVIAGTGHRPDKLGGYGREAFKKLIKVAEAALTETKPDKLISGVALGWDQALAVAAIYKKIPYIAATPCVGQDKIWPKESQALYNYLLSCAVEVVVVSPGPYAPWKMHERNKWMVDRCDKVVALYNGSKGGTFNCIEYAKSVGKPIENFWSLYERTV